MVTSQSISRTTSIDFDLDCYLLSQTTRIEECLNQILPETTDSYNVLFQAARYSLLNGGKRLRPILTLAVVETLGGNIDQALIPACALEIVHTYSLIHDDLPCMDDDDFRRGKPSLHRAFPESHAVLAGDFLLTYAFEILTNAPGLSAEVKLSLISILAQAAGGQGMIAGQILDMDSERTTIDLATLELTHRKKTGALISAATLFGGILAGATQKHQKLLEQFGQEIGLAFQIADDLLDADDPSKASYLRFMSADDAKVLTQRLLQSALVTLSSVTEDTVLLNKLADRLVNRTK